VGRIYAGVLGPLAFTTVTLRGVIGGADPKNLLVAAWLFLILFAAAGYVVGRLADWIIEDAVRSRLATELSPPEAERPVARKSAS